MRFGTINKAILGCIVPIAIAIVAGTGTGFVRYYAVPFPCVDIFRVLLNQPLVVSINKYRLNISQTVQNVLPVL